MPTSASKTSSTGGISTHTQAEGAVNSVLQSPVSSCKLLTDGLRITGRTPLYLEKYEPSIPTTNALTVKILSIRSCQIRPTERPLMVRKPKSTFSHKTRLSFKPYE